MTDRISFDGQEYENIESMPPAVRAAYEDAISKIRQSSADAASVLAALGGISPGLFSRAHSEHYLRAHHQAKQTAARVLPVLLVCLVVGLLTLGAWMAWQLNASVQPHGGNPSVWPGFLILVVVTTLAGIGMAMWMTVRRDEPAGVREALDGIEHVGARVLQLLLGVAAGGVVAAGYWMISNMDASSRSQAGDVFVGVGVLVALAVIAGMYVSIETRLKR
jgi:hypothetical protein